VPFRRILGFHLDPEVPPAGVNADLTFAAERGRLAGAVACTKLTSTESFELAARAHL
jgi:hypothetical protein